MGKKSGPTPPDPMETANAQAQANAEAVRESALVNQINQVTPYGNVTYTGEIGTPDRTQVTTLNPGQQRVLDAQTGIAGILGDLGVTQAGALGGQLAQPFSLDSLGQMSTGIDARNAAESALLGRLEPMMARDEDALRNRLANQGITQGSEAYSNAMSDFSQGRNDARLAAIAAAGGEQSRQFGMDQAARQQQLSELLTQRQQPINELAALLQGAPAITTVQPNQSAQYNLQAPDIMGATMQQYNAQAANQASQMGGLYGLGGALGGATIMAMSDVREKTDIRRVGSTDAGQPVYTFRYRSDPDGPVHMGVMAQESPLEAVGIIHTADGPRLGVDYGKIR